MWCWRQSWWWKARDQRRAEGRKIRDGGYWREREEVSGMRCGRGQDSDSAAVRRPLPASHCLVLFSLFGIAPPCVVYGYPDIQISQLPCTASAACLGYLMSMSRLHSTHHQQVVSQRHNAVSHRRDALVTCLGIFEALGAGSYLEPLST